MELETPGAAAGAEEDAGLSALLEAAVAVGESPTAAAHEERMHTPAWPLYIFLEYL